MKTDLNAIDASNPNEPAFTGGRRRSRTAPFSSTTASISRRILVLNSPLGKLSRLNACTWVSLWCSNAVRLNFDVAQKAGISTSSGVLDVHCPSPERFQIHPDSKSPVFLPPNGKRSSLGCKKLELSSPVCPLTGAIHDLVEFHRRTISSADYFLERQWYHEELFMKELPRIAKGWCSLAYAMAAFATLHYYKKAGPTTSVYITALTCYENAVRKLYDSLFKDPDSIDESLARVATALSLSAFEVSVPRFIGLIFSEF